MSIFPSRLRSRRHSLKNKEGKGARQSVKIAGTSPARLIFRRCLFPPIPPGIFKVRAQLPLPIPSASQGLGNKGRIESNAILSISNIKRSIPIPTGVFFGQLAGKDSRLGHNSKPEVLILHAPRNFGRTVDRPGEMHIFDHPGKSESSDEAQGSWKAGSERSRTMRVWSGADQYFMSRIFRRA